MTQKKEIELKALLTEAHQEHQKGLNARAFFKVNNRAVSEDLVANTFMKTWQYLVKGGKIDTMKAFLYHILNNLIIDEYRKHKTTSLDVLIEKGFEPSTIDPKRLFDILDDAKLLLLIKKIPVKYQKILHMRYMQDLSIKEMSISSGTSKKTIAVQIHRGLAKLKLCYSTY